MTWVNGRIIRFLVFFVLVSVPVVAKADSRVALVVGNSAYKHVPSLKNPKNDAEGIAAALERLDFKVIRGIDLDHSEFVSKVKEYTRAIRGADIALLYYAGHGLQVRGENYLAPVDTELFDEADLEFETIRLEAIMSQMERERRTNLVFLDACRDNPLTLNLAQTMGTRSLGPGRGLAPVETGVGTLVAYSTQPGNVAYDGSGEHSPFTAALLEHLEAPGDDIAVILRRVRQQVLQATDGRQVPWSNSSLTGPVVLREAPKVDPMIEQRRLDLAYWESIKGSQETLFFETYLERFPNGQFSDLASLKIASIRKKQAERADLLRELQEKSRRQASALEELEAERRRLIEEKKRDAARQRAALAAANEEASRREQQIAFLNEEKALLAKETEAALALQENALATARKEAATQLEQLEQLTQEKARLERQSRELSETQKRELEQAVAALQQNAEEVERLRAEKQRLEQEGLDQAAANQKALEIAEKDAETNSALIAKLEAQAQDAQKAADKTIDPVRQAELLFWDSINKSDDPADFDEYLNRFPDSTFSGVARRRLALLRTGEEILPAEQALEAEPTGVDEAVEPQERLDAVDFKLLPDSGIVLQRGHKTSVDAFSYQDDKGQLLSVAGDKTKRWDLATGVLLESIKTASSPGTLFSVISKNGNYVANAYTGRNADLWDTEKGNVLQQFRAAGTNIRSIAFSADGEQIAIASWSGPVYFFGTASGQLLKIFSFSSESMNRIAFSPDGRKIIGITNGVLQVWNLETGRHETTIAGHKNIEALSFSPDGTRIATGARDGSVKIWNEVTGRLILQINAHSNTITSVDFSQDGRKLVTASIGTLPVKIWDISSGQLIASKKQRSTHASKAQFLTNGAEVVTNAKNGTLEVLSADTGKTLRTLGKQVPRYDEVLANSEGTSVVTTGPGTFAIWEVPTEKLTTSDFGQRDELTIRGFSAEKNRILISKYDQIQLRDSRNGNIIKTFSKLAYLPPNILSLSPDGRKLLSISKNETRIIDAETGYWLDTLSEHIADPAHSEFSPDGNRLAISNSDKLLLFNTNSGRLTKEIKPSQGRITNVVFSPNSEFLAIGSNYTAELRDAKSGALLSDLKGIERNAEIAFSPEGELILIGDQLRATVSGEMLRTLTHKGMLLSSAFSRDGRQLLTGSDIGEIKLWDAFTGKEVRSLPNMSGPVHSIAFSAIGDRAYVAAEEFVTVNLFNSNEVVSRIALGRGEYVAWDATGHWHATEQALRQSVVAAISSNGQVIQQDLQAHPDFSNAAEILSQPMISAIGKEAVGNASALNSLYLQGSWLLNEHNRKRNPRRAASLLDEAAKQGDGRAMFLLGLLFANGDDEVPIDSTRAAAYLLSAYLVGDELAETYLLDANRRLPGNLIRSLQESLKTKGHYTGTIDGDFGPRSKDALISVRG